MILLDEAHNLVRPTEARFEEALGKLRKGFRSAEYQLSESRLKEQLKKAEENRVEAEQRTRLLIADLEEMLNEKVKQAQRKQLEVEQVY